MGKFELSRSRTVVEPLFEFDVLSQNSLPPISLPSPPSFCSLAIYYQSESEALVYAGTRSGALLLLSVDLNFLPSSTTSSSSLLSSDKVRLLRFIWVSDCAIDSIHVLAQISRVLVLSDGFIYLTDSLLRQPTKKSSGLVKGITVMSRRVRSNLGSVSDNANFTKDGALSNQSTSQRLLKKIGAGIRSNGVWLKELDMNRDNNDFVFAVATAKKLFFIQLVDGLSGSFVVLKEFHSLEGIKSMVWLDDSVIFGTSGEYSLISCHTGQTTMIFSLPDASSQPKLKLLSKDQKVLLLVDNAGIVVNAVGQPICGSLVFRQAPDSIGELSSYVVVAGGGKIELYHKNSGACVQSISLGGPGVQGCVLAEEDGGGRFVVVATPSKVICYHRIPYEEQIKDLLRKKNFEEAIALVEELVCEGEITKEMVSLVHAQVGFLLLFDLRFKEAVDNFLLSDIMDPSEIFPFVMRDPNRWSLLVPRNRYWGLHPPPAHIEDVIEDGLVAIQRAIFLKKAGVETAIHTDFLVSPPCRADLLDSAFRNIIRYLEDSRERELTPQVQEGVDTLLMYLYRTLNCVGDMENLASSENSCVVEELEALLEESGHLRTLAFLYANKGMSSKALAIWRALARNYSSSPWSDPATGTTLQGKVVSGQKIAASEASKILSRSSDQDLVLQHLGWVSELDEELAIQVLTSAERTQQLSADDVIAATDPRKIEILQRYIQWLIEDQDSRDTQFHTLYALSLAKSALESLVEISMDDVESRTRNCLYGRRPDFSCPVRDRLQKFLLSSDIYDPEEVLELIEGSELWLEKAILYKRLGQETLVLQILALKLEDSEAAEQYCAELGRPDAYMQLLDMYLDPQNGKEPMFKAAVRLLHNHGETLDPLQVLERLSPDMPLQLASETILRMLRARLHHHRQGQIVSDLSRAVDVDVRLARLEERARHVQINDESLCESCHARLGTKLFAMYPDDSIVCYKCFRRQGDSTSVTGRNFKRDVLFKPGWLVSR